MLCAVDKNNVGSKNFVQNFITINFALETILSFHVNARMKKWRIEDLFYNPLNFVAQKRILFIYLLKENSTFYNYYWKHFFSKYLFTTIFGKNWFGSHVHGLRGYTNLKSTWIEYFYFLLRESGEFQVSDKRCGVNMKSAIYCELLHSDHRTEFAAWT